LTEEIMGVQNFNFAPNFFQNDVSSPKVSIYDENVLTRRYSNTFPTAQNFGLSTAAKTPLTK